MARKKIEIEQGPPTKTVEVIERHSYMKEVPVEDVNAISATKDEEPQAPDVFAMFNEIVSANQSALLRIWRLPNYDIDGRTSMNATDREYCGSVSYNADNAILLDQISGRVPMGGMVQLELFADGAIRKRGLLKLIKKADAINPAYTGQGGPSLVINQPQASNGARLNPSETVRDTLGLLKDMGEVMKTFMPVPVVPAAAETPEPAPLKDRLLEGILVSAFKGDNVPGDRFDKVLEVLAGGKSEPSWIDALVSGVAPHIGPVLNQIGPGLNALLMRLATGAPVEASSVPVQTSSSGALSEGASQAESAPDPVQRAWQRVLFRLLDDMWEHVEAVNRGALGISVTSAAEAIADLADRFQDNEQIMGTIGQMLSLPPEQVIEACALMVPPALTERIIGMKSSAAALAWLVELQVTTREILAEVNGQQQKQQQEEASTNENT